MTMFIQESLVKKVKENIPLDESFTIGEINQQGIPIEGFGKKMSYHLVEFFHDQCLIKVYNSDSLTTDHIDTDYIKYEELESGTLEEIVNYIELWKKEEKKKDESIFDENNIHVIRGCIFLLVDKKKVAELLFGIYTLYSLDKDGWVKIENEGMLKSSDLIGIPVKPLSYIAENNL